MLLCEKSAVQPVEIRTGGHSVVIKALPMQATNCIDVIETVNKLAELESSACVYTSHVIQAVLLLHWALHAQNYHATRAKRDMQLLLLAVCSYGIMYTSELFSTYTSYINAMSIAVVLTLYTIFMKSQQCPMTPTSGKLAYYGLICVSLVCMLISGLYQPEAASNSSNAIGNAVDLKVACVFTWMLLALAAVDDLQLKQQWALYGSSLFHMIAQLSVHVAYTAAVLLIASKTVGILYNMQFITHSSSCGIIYSAVESVVAFAKSGSILSFATTIVKL
jgi:hypothetical protein